MLTPATITHDMCPKQKEMYNSLYKTVPEWKENFLGNIPYDFSYIPKHYKLLFRAVSDRIEILHSTSNPCDTIRLDKILTISFANNETAYSQNQYYRKLSLHKHKYFTEFYLEMQQDVFYKNKNIIIYSKCDDVHILIS